MRLAAIVVILTFTAVPSVTFAQPPQPSQGPPAAVGEEAAKPTRNFVSALFHNLGDDVKHLPRSNTVYWLAGGAATALAIHPIDDATNERLDGSPGLWTAGRVIGATPTILAAGTAAYLVGRTKALRRLQHLGLDEIEGAILTAGIVEGAKQIGRRDRPLRDDGTRQPGFSFPSGHAATTFAAATILQQHLGYRAGIPTYLVASYVAMSRLHDNRHFASDVAFGAATGIVIGRSVTWHGRNFYGYPSLQESSVALVISVQ